MSSNGSEGSGGGGGGGYEPPSWLSDLAPLAQYVDMLVAFARNPVFFISVIAVGWILDLWESVLDLFEGIWAELAVIPQEAFVEPLLAAGGAFRALIDVYQAFGDTAIEVASGLGPVAPIAVLIAWFIPIVMMAALVHFGLGVLDTYLPLSDLPLVGRVFR